MAKLDGTNGLIQQYDYQVLTTGFSYTFASGTQTLVINPAGTLATGTITMTAAPADGMVLWITSTQQIVALTINGNTGQTVVGKVTSLAPNQAVAYIYRLANTTWYPFETQMAQGNGPAFSAYAGSATTLTNGAYTKVTFDTEEFDTNNNFASSRFTPTVAGYYQLTSCIGFSASVASEAVLALYKNGSNYKYAIDIQASTLVMIQGTFLVYANGTTDYFEIYVYQNSSRTSVASSSQTYFQGAMVRSA